MNQPLFNYVEFAGPGIYKRNNIVELSDIDNWVKKTKYYECYKSMFRFDGELIKYFQGNIVKGKDEKEYNSVMGYDGLCYADYLTIDIDSENLEEALCNAKNLIKNFQLNYGILPEQLKYFFSGKKGFHILLPIGLFGEITPHKEFNKWMRNMALELTHGCKVDPAIYDKNRLIRIVNTRNHKSGLFKIPLTWQEFVSCKIDEIQNMAKEKREIPLVSKDVDKNDQLCELFNKMKSEKYRPVIQAKETKDFQYSKKGKYCILKIMNDGVVQSQRNDSIVRLTTHFKNEGFNLDVVKGIILGWNGICVPPAPENDVVTRIEGAYFAGYKYGCSDVFYSSFCSDKCIYYKEDKNTISDIKTLEELEQDYVQYIAKLENSKIDFANWIPSLRKISRGFCPGEVIVIMAGTGVGKSAILQNLMLNIPNISMYISLELPESLVFERFMQMETQQSGVKVEEEYVAKRSLSEIVCNRKNILTVTKPCLSINEIKEYVFMAEKEKVKDKISLIGIDYLGLLQGYGSTRYEIVSNIADRLKQLAKDTDTVVVVLVQISRLQGGDGTTDLSLNSAKDSGSIENNADMVIGVSRPNRGKEDDYLKLIVLKNRKGPDNKVIICNFNLNTLTITERTKDEGQYEDR